MLVDPSRLQAAYRIGRQIPGILTQQDAQRLGHIKRRRVAGCGANRWLTVMSNILISLLRSGPIAAAYFRHILVRAMHAGHNAHKMQHGGLHG